MKLVLAGSHLFQRVASFLHVSLVRLGIYFSEEFSSLSESGFIPTGGISMTFVVDTGKSSHLFQRVASFLPAIIGKLDISCAQSCSHLFQRVASFLRS